MKLTVTITYKGKKTEYQVNRVMTIKDTLRIIFENESYELSENSQYIYSKRKEENVNANLTFKEAGIYSGDELIVERVENYYAK